MKPHYFDSTPDADDWQLKMAIGQGYVPATCLLGGAVVMSEINAARNPCYGCNCNRDKCHGKPRNAQASGE